MMARRSKALTKKMRGRPLERWLDAEFVAAVKKLRRSTDVISRAKGAMNSGDTVDVDYFALCDLLEFYDEVKSAAANVVIARDALHQAFFSSGSNVDSRS